MLTIQNFTKRYKTGPPAVSELSLQVNSGDIFGFIGLNGAGKTTTIRAITGILDFEEGDIFVDGNSVKQSPVDCKAVTAYIPDNPDPYGYLKGIQYLNFVGDIFRVPKEERQRRISRYAGIFDITDRLGDPISSYSHGMKQKVALIAALLHKPKLLVLDEPFVGLDPAASHQLKEIMRQLCAEGSAIFFSTHILEVAEKLCNKIGIIKQGKLIAYGTLDEVRGDSSLENVFLELTDHA